MRQISNKIIVFFRNQQATALIEFVFALPILLLLMVGAIELSNYVYANQKNQSAASNIANLINIEANITTDGLTKIADAFPRIVRPFSVSEYRVIVTIMQRDSDDDANPPAGGYILWQESLGGGAGSSKADPDDLNGFVFEKGDQILVVETYMPYKPLMDNALTRELLGLDDSPLYHMTPPYRPRVGAFQIDPDELT